MRVALVSMLARTENQSFLKRRCVISRLLICVSAAFVALTTLFLFGGSADATTRHTFATCTPSAYSYLGQKQIEAIGTARCDSGAPCYYFDVRAASSSGKVLREWLNTSTCWSGGQQWATGFANCAGLYVHSFFYINVGGTGKSYTTGDAWCY
jgi:hypothetical protein